MKLVVNRVGYKSAKKVAEAFANFLEERIILSEKLSEHENKKAISLSDALKLINNGSFDENCFINYTEDEINEFTSLVVESLTKYPILDYSNINSFTDVVKIALVNLNNNISVSSVIEELNHKKQYKPVDKKQKLKSIKKYVGLSGMKNPFDIDPRVKGSMFVRNNNELVLKDSNDLVAVDVLYNYTNAHLLEAEKEIEDELLFIDKLYVGHLNVALGNGKFKSRSCILLEKQVDDLTLMKAFIYDGKLYGGYIDDKTDFVSEVISFSEFLRMEGMSILEEDIYNLETLKKVINVCNAYRNISAKDKSKIIEVAYKASEWWAHQIFDFNNLSNKSDNLNQVDNSKVEEERELFKSKLEDLIIMKLGLNPEMIEIQNDYICSGILLSTALKARINPLTLNMPWKVQMRVSKDNIAVKGFYDKNWQVIFQREEEKVDEGIDYVRQKSQDGNINLDDMIS